MSDAQRVYAAAKAMQEKKYNAVVNEMTNKGLDEFTFDSVLPGTLQDLFIAGGFLVSVDKFEEQTTVRVPRKCESGSAIISIGAGTWAGFQAN